MASTRYNVNKSVCLPFVSQKQHSTMLGALLAPGLSSFALLPALVLRGPNLARWLREFDDAILTIRRLTLIRAVTNFRA